MTINEAAAIIKQHNVWRRWDGDLREEGAPNPVGIAELELAIDLVAAYIEEVNWQPIETAPKDAGAAEMTEQELRAAVAEYCPLLAKRAAYSASYGWLKVGVWTIESNWTQFEEGMLTIHAAGRPNAATMRAMDAAAKAFEEAVRMKESGSV